MNFGFIIIICIFTISVVVIVAMRMRLKIRSNNLSGQIKRQIPFSERSSDEQTKEKSSKLNEKLFVDISTDITNSFNGEFISFSKEKELINYYTAIFNEANSLSKKLKFLGITPSETISKFISDFGIINRLIKRHNEGIINSLLDTHKDFFDHCLKYPLDKQQRRSIVSEEDNCLVVSSAGSGKTSSIIGKVKYLIHIKGIDPQRILLISYTNKAAAELTERMETAGLKGYTFHKLAIDLIGQTTGIKPSICDNTDALLVGIFHDLLENEDFRKSIMQYFVDYQTNEAEWEQRKNKRREQLSEQKNTQIKALLPDMDGKTISVKSVQEQKICFVLSSLVWGIK